MNFLNDLKSSLYNPFFYASLRARTLGSSFKYFFFLVVILAFVIAFVWGSQLSPLFAGENLKKLVDYYPSELTLAIKGGVISTNVAEPYIIQDGGKFSKENSHANMVVIDTKNAFSRELFKQYDTSVWVGRDFVVSSKNQDRTEISDVSRMPDFDLNRGRLLNWVDIVGRYHWLLSLGLFAGLFSAFLGLFIFQLLWLALMALFILLLSKLMKISLSYKGSFQVAIHAATVPLILLAFFMVGGISEPFLFFFSLILLIIAFVNLKKTEQTA